MYILIVIIIFLELIYWIVIFDVILSWLTLLWLKARPKFVADIIDPLYKNIKKILPTSIWPIDLTPIVVIIIIIFIKWLLFMAFPELKIEASNLMK